MSQLAVRVAFFTVIPPALVSPPTVPRVSFVNPTAYAIEIQVTDARRDGQMDLGTAAPQATTVVQTIIDQGETWIVHFASQGHDGGEVVVTRAALRSSGWQISIPMRWARNLHAQARPRPQLLLPSTRAQRTWIARSRASAASADRLRPPQLCAWRPNSEASAVGIGQLHFFARQLVDNLAPGPLATASSSRMRT